MALSAWSATAIAETMINPAIVMIGKDKIGITTGGQQFDPGISWSELDFDGKRTTIKGGSRVEKYEPKISTTLLQLGKSDGSQLLKLNPGGTVATGTSGVTNTLTPVAAGKFLASADYTTNLRLIWELGDNTNLLAVLFPIALCTKWDIQGGSIDEAKVSAEWTAVIDPTTGLVQCPFQIEFRTALPTT